jgi:hypothetical protein
MTHAVLGEDSTRALVYVGMTRGSESNMPTPTSVGGISLKTTRGSAVACTRYGAAAAAAEVLRGIVATDAHAQTATTSPQAPTASTCPPGWQACSSMIAPAPRAHGAGRTKSDAPKTSSSRPSENIDSTSASVAAPSAGKAMASNEDCTSLRCSLVARRARSFFTEIERIGYRSTRAQNRIAGR